MDQKIRALKKKATESELQPLDDFTKKPVRRIYRCPTVYTESSEDSRQLKEPDKTSGQPRITGDNAQLRRASSDNIKVWKLEESHPRFGPVYRTYQRFDTYQRFKDIKDKAWEHILKNSLENDHSVTKEIYLTAIRNVEKEAKATYAENISVEESDFRWMMIKDGCFFLQLALSILGRPKKFWYPLNDPIFGKKQNKKDVTMWIEAMFFVGNQIPLVVLDELLKQKFFQNVIANGHWDPPPSGFCKKVLYEVLVLPALKRSLPNQGPSLRETIYLRRDNNFVDQRPFDLLHALQNLVIGPGQPDDLSSEYEADDEIDLEANEEDADDYERNFPGAIDGGAASPSDMVDRLKNLLNAVAIPGDIVNRERTFPSATELTRAGISIKTLKSGGARSIHFRSNYLWAFLYLPAFLVDDHTEIIFRSLKTYEICQQLGKNRTEVGSYLRVMSDIIQTAKDVKLLSEKGIIQGKSDDVEKLPRKLSRLSSEDIRLTHELRSLRRQIRDYSSPLVHYKGIINIVVILTALQTVFAILAYVRPPKY